MKRRAFTLIELMIVILLICVMLAWLLPYLSGARANARSTVCKSNLRQISTMLGVYLASNAKARWWGLNEVSEVVADNVGHCPASQPWQYTWSYTYAITGLSTGGPLAIAIIEHKPTDKVTVAMDTLPWHGYGNTGYLDTHGARR